MEWILATAAFGIGGPFIAALLLARPRTRPFPCKAGETESLPHAGDGSSAGTAPDASAFAAGVDAVSDGCGGGDGGGGGD